MFFFFNDTATTEIYTLSLHDALPIFPRLERRREADDRRCRFEGAGEAGCRDHDRRRSEEHTSELQSPCNLVCRLLLEKKNNSLTACARHPTRLALMGAIRQITTAHAS